MGKKNYFIERESYSGKTTVCKELQQRGYHAINGDPEIGQPTPGFYHEHHIWDVDKVKTIISNNNEPVTFFYDGSRNYTKFI